MDNQYFVYLLSNKNNTVIYTGVTNELKQRVYEHKKKMIDGFTKKYNVNELLYFEFTSDINSAIQREKQIKAGSRQKKIDLVNSINKEWKDLYNEI